MKQKTNMLSRLGDLVEQWVENHQVIRNQRLQDLTAGLAVDLKNEPCIIWFGAKKKCNGYGVVHKAERQLMAHREAYKMAYGNIPRNMNICHSCDNPACVNPSHLFAASQRDNLLDMRLKGREHKVGPKGNNNPKSIFRPNEVLTIRKEFGLGVKIETLRQRFGGTYQSIHAIVHHKTWQHINQNP